METVVKEEPDYLNVSVRSSARKRKPRTIFDPSGIWAPRGYSAAVTSNTAGLAEAGPQPSKTAIKNEKACFVCLKRCTYSKKNIIIKCLDCSRKAHKNCVQIEFEDMDALQKNYKCDKCRTCNICDSYPHCSFKINKPLITCCKCVKSYHLRCHEPTVIMQEIGPQWKCTACQHSIGGNGLLPIKEEQATNEYSFESGGMPGIKHEAEFSGNGDGKDNYNIMDEIELPNVKGWSVDKVVKFFYEYFPTEAYVFKVLEIDGDSLLLLKRGDVINKFPLTLGRKLRIYSLILKIQAQRNSPTLGWN